MTAVAFDGAPIASGAAFKPSLLASQIELLMSARAEVPTNLIDVRSRPMSR